MSQFVGGVQLPPVSKEFIDQLEAAFPGPEVRPGFDRDSVLWAAAQRDIIDWIKNHAAVNHKNDPVAAQKAIVRYGS